MLQVLPYIKSMMDINIPIKIIFCIIYRDLFSCQFDKKFLVLYNCNSAEGYMVQGCINLILKGFRNNLYFCLTFWCLEFMIGWMHLHSISRVFYHHLPSNKNMNIIRSRSSFLMCHTCGKWPEPAINTEYANQVSLYDTLFPISSPYSGICSLMWNEIYTEERQIRTYNSSHFSSFMFAKCWCSILILLFWEGSDFYIIIISYYWDSIYIFCRTTI
jgi:hypothetical protein